MCSERYRRVRSVIALGFKKQWPDQIISMSLVSMEVGLCNMKHSSQFCCRNRRGSPPVRGLSFGLRFAGMRVTASIVRIGLLSPFSSTRKVSVDW